MAVDVRYRNFFILRVEKNLKISPWDEKLTSRGPTALGRVSFTSRGLIFGGFFNPWDEEISIPDIRLIRKSLIPVLAVVLGYFLRLRDSGNILVPLLVQE